MLEAREGHLGNRVLLMSSLLSRNNRCVSRKGEVDTWEAGVMIE